MGYIFFLFRREYGVCLFTSHRVLVLTIFERNGMCGTKSMVWLNGSLWMSYRLIFVLPALCVISRGNLHQMVTCFAVFYTIKWRKLFYASLSISLPPLITLQTTPSIPKSNYSPPSLGNHRSLFVKPAKRGKQGAGGEALSPFHYFPFYYQPRHPHNYFTTQLRWYCAIIPVDEFRKINALMVQLGTSCSFDSPGLARNEPTPGQRSQGDSTP